MFRALLFCILEVALSSNVSFQRLEPGVPLQDSITGFGWRYYAIDVPSTSFLDVVTIVERGKTDALDDCEGWRVYLTLNESVPQPDRRAISNAETEEVYSSILSSTFIAILQQSILCDVLSAAKESIKAANPPVWWVMVQTRGGDEDANNVTCKYTLHVQRRDRETTLWVGVGCIAGFIAWMLWFLYTTFTPVLRTGFVIHRPHVALHEFVLQLPLLFANSCVLALRNGFSALSRKVGGCVASCRMRQQRRTTEQDVEMRSLATEPDPESGPTQTTTSSSSVALQPTAAEADDDGRISRNLLLDDSHLCRICKDDTTEDLIQPCACQGSMQFVHASCLNKWRNESLNMGNPENARRCEVCHHQFELVAPEQPQWKVCLTCTASAASNVWRVVYTVSVYVLAMSGMAWAVAATIGRATCVAPFDMVNASAASVQFWFVGIVYYAVLSLHVYACLYWHWLVWLNHVRQNRLSVAEYPFFVWWRLLWMAYTFFRLLLLEIGIGYIVKYLFYIGADGIVWYWDISLTVGLVVVILIVVIAMTGFVIKDFVERWYRSYVQQLETVQARVAVPARARGTANERSPTLVQPLTGASDSDTQGTA
eukprot:TRINITY_DN11454_c0_g1_i2.p1 TRINITY_DN11454_c0_g1~~TRINITY_DN11454_c0_g1_i2.p1  ORF type:complete len:597 (+),score=75.77 TRINITY_DN11454_c0_g1_i2:80-1870(+)